LAGQDAAGAAGTAGAAAGEVGAAEQLSGELAGLDELEIELPPAPSRLGAVWQNLWPKLAAIALALAIWQVVVWSGWKPSYLLPGPATVLRRLVHNLFGGNPVSGHLVKATSVTLRRAVSGYLMALVIGTLLGVAIAQSRILRAALGSLITGFQTMPSVAWLPLAVVLFQLSEGAILFVLLIGAIPSIANGVVSGIDNVPPLLLRAGRVLGARGYAKYRHVVLPAALPGFVAGMKQGWAFAWRSLMAGELIVTIAHRPSLGGTLENASSQNDYVGLMAAMVVILLVGLLLDALVFGRLERIVLRRRGLAQPVDIGASRLRRIS
jgi:NitT/TauT family transport system permease protein